MSLIVKICGLSTAETLDVALEQGADAVGFVFFPPSPRHLGYEAARNLGARVKGRAEKVALSGTKKTTKMAYRHSGYPGGLSATPIGEVLEKDARKAIEKAVWGMLPKNKLGRQMLKKLKVYSGPDHPHQAQKAIPFEIKQISQ